MANKPTQAVDSAVIAASQLHLGGIAKTFDPDNQNQWFYRFRSGENSTEIEEKAALLSYFN